MSGDTEPQHGALKVLVVQREVETLATELAERGFLVVHDTNDPITWLDDLVNAMSIDAIVVSPAAVVIDSPMADDIATLIRDEVFLLYMVDDAHDLVRLEWGDLPT